MRLYLYQQVDILFSVLEELLKSPFNKQFDDKVKHVLRKHGLDVVEGEIVKTQRTVSAEAKEAGYGESAKYLVTRTSLWNDEKPVEEATPIMVHRYIEFSTFADKRYREKERKGMEVTWEKKDGSFGGYYKEPDEAWLCDIPDLHEFVKKYGKIILMEPKNKEGCWEVEIYDDYRE